MCWAHWPWGIMEMPCRDQADERQRKCFKPAGRALRLQQRSAAQGFSAAEPLVCAFIN